MSLTLSNLQTSVDGSAGSATINGGTPNFSPAAILGGAGLTLAGTSAVIDFWSIAGETSILSWHNSPSVQHSDTPTLSVVAGSFQDSTGIQVGTVTNAVVTNLVPAVTGNPFNSIISSDIIGPGIYADDVINPDVYARL